MNISFVILKQFTMLRVKIVLDIDLLVECMNSGRCHDILSALQAMCAGRQWIHSSYKGKLNNSDLDDFFVVSHKSAFKKIKHKTLSY